MRISLALFVSLLLFGAVSWASAQDQEQLLGKSRSALLKEIGTPLKEVTDAKVTGGLFQSVIVDKDEKTGTLYLYFISHGVTAAYASMDYYKDSEADQLAADQQQAVKDLGDNGFTLATGPEAEDGLYFNADSEEYDYLGVNTLDDGSTVFYELYAKATADLKDEVQVLANLDQSLQ